jgi:hypothetical protein
MHTCAESHFFKEKSSHDFEFFEKTGKSQSQRKVKVKVKVKGL